MSFHDWLVIGVDVELSKFNVEIQFRHQLRNPTFTYVQLSFPNERTLSFIQTRDLPRNSSVRPLAPTQSTVPSPLFNIPSPLPVFCCFHLGFCSVSQSERSSFDVLLPPSLPPFLGFLPFLALGRDARRIEERSERLELLRTMVGRTGASTSHASHQFLNTVLSQRGPQALPYVEDDKWSIRQHLLLVIQEFPGLQVRFDFGVSSTLFLVFVVFTFLFCRDLCPREFLFSAVEVGGV